MDEAGVLARLHVPCDEHAPARVRDSLRQAIGSDPRTADALLVLSELVTNAVRHSGGSSRDGLEVLVAQRDGHLLVSVRDPGRSGTSARLADPPAGFGGLGLRIVERLATQWGHERDGGYRVWCRLPFEGTRT